MMMICAWGLICFTPIQNSQRFEIRISQAKGKMNAKRPTCPVGSFPSKAGTPKNRVWRHTRAQIFTNDVAAGTHAGAIIPVGTTVSVHGLRPSPSKVITIHCSRPAEFCQGNGDFVYNSFTDETKQAPFPAGRMLAWGDLWRFNSARYVGSDVYTVCRYLVHGADIQVYLTVAHLVLGEQTVILVPKGAAGRLAREQAVFVQHLAMLRKIFALE